MSELIKRKVRSLHPLMSIKTLIQRTQRHILLPFYHTVSKHSLPHIQNLYQHRSLQQFEQDLDFFCEHFEPITINELYHLIDQKKRPDRPVFHLTFDDGLREFYSVAAPILERKNIPATVFLNSAFIDNRTLFYRYKVSLLLNAIKSSSDYNAVSKIFNTTCASSADASRILLEVVYDERNILDSLAHEVNFNFNDFLSNEKPYMTSEQISDLINRGFTFGSHSNDHPLFNLIKRADQEKQVVQSFELLERNFTIKERYFSFPFSDEGVSKDFIDWLHVEQDIRLSFGISGLKDDTSPFHLHRIPMEGHDESAESIIKSEYIYYMLKSLVNKNKIKRS